MVKIPGIEERRWYDNGWIVELITSVPPAATAFIGSAALLLDKSKPRAFGIISLVVGVWIVGAGVLRIMRAAKLDKNSRAKECPTDLLGCAYVVYTLLKQVRGIRDGDGRRLRMTIHRVVWSDKEQKTPVELEQIIPYVGGIGGDAGRHFPIICGVAGLVVSEHAPIACSWNGVNSAEFINELVTRWHYPQHEAVKMVTYRRSWFGVPINGRSDTDTIGVVFFDSDISDFFNEETQNLAIAACCGIADYIKERYS